MTIFVALSILAIAVLLVLSAFFSGSETAITAASRPRMHTLERQGDPRAATINRLRQRKDRLIGAILFGNNLVNISASALATSILIGFFGDAGVAYATVVMTLLILIFSEVLPKSYAIQNADRVALAVARPLRWVVWAFAPVTMTIQAIVGGTLGLLGIREDSEPSADHREEELRGAIELHEGPEPEFKRERAMLRSILDLDEVEVGEIMIHRKNVAMIDADLPPAEIVEQVLQSPYTRIPLWQDDPDNVVGVLHAKALLLAIKEHGSDLDTLDIRSIALKPWFIPESTSLLDQLQAFRDKGEHFALVVDEYGSLMGIVTLEDILEEIVGEIRDEHDVLVTGVRRQPDGSYIVDGNVTIRDLNRDLEWNLPDEEAATIAGLVMYEARTIPEVGQTFDFYGFRFEILRRQRNQITSIRVTPPDAQKGAKGAQPAERPVPTG